MMRARRADVQTALDLDGDGPSPLPYRRACRRNYAAMSPRPARRAPQAVPRYLEIERALRADIARLHPGDPLPSDAELCERFGVSRMTARQGVKRLADANLVFRVPGQGTFVADPSVHPRAGGLRAFSGRMRTPGPSPHSRVLEIGERPAEGDEQSALRIPAGEPVVAIRRLRLGDD